MDSATKRRPAAMQFSPLLKKTALIAWRMARSKSQSAKIIRGDFPPNSNETFLTLLAAQLKSTQFGLIPKGKSKLVGSYDFII